MALVLIANPRNVLEDNSDWLNFVAREDKSNIGTGLSIPIFTLTNWDGSTTKPQIAEGSIIEVGGSIYQADADTALTDEGGLSDGTVHIKLVPAGGGATVVPTLTNDSIPSWNAVKGGWYDLDDKFLPFEMTKASAVYTGKSEYVDQNKSVKIYSNGNIGNDITINNDLTVNGEILPELTVNTSWAITTTPFVIPRGIYQASFSANSVVLEIFVLGSWRNLYKRNTASNNFDAGGAFFSDGANVRIKTFVGSVTVYYQKY